MLLSKLFKGAPDIDILQLSVDSRVPMKNAIFFCLDGIKYNGHDYIDEAIKNGAKVIVHNREVPKRNDALMIRVPDVKQVMNKVANIFYNYPNQNVNNYIISGNYGRSSVSSFIYYYLNRIGVLCGYIGILGIKYKEVSLKSSFPTMNALDNLRILHKMKNNGVKNCTFEASSSSLNLQKLDTVVPNTFIYTCTNEQSSEYQTNDYYQNLKDYISTFSNETKVILNIDDISYQHLKTYVNNHVTYGANEQANYRIKEISLGPRGLSFKLIHNNNTYVVNNRLQGVGNVYNLTAAIVALSENGYDINDIINKLQSFGFVEGVMERVDDQYNVIVDCAYDLNCVEDVLKYVKLINQNNKSIGVIGINYTDSDKRIEKIMNLCEKYLDIIILTEDETLQGETMSILSRCDKYTNSVRVIHSPFRSIAIENAIEIMNSNDTCIILGKGNENFLQMGLGKEFYHGDSYYAKKFINKRRSEENEIS